MRKRIAMLGTGLLTMLSCVLTGCGDAGTSGTEASEQSQTTQASEETLVIGIQTNAYVTDYNDNYLTKYLEDELDINLEFYELPADGDEVNTKISLLATNEEELPDVIMTPVLSPEVVLEYGSNGMFIPLNEYLEQEGTNFSQVDETSKEIMLTAMTSADGNIYALPNYCDTPWNITPNRLFINTAWLDKLGMEVPTTTDELYTALKAFADNDPNGNGIKDEIGAYGYTDGSYGYDIVDSLMNAFVFYNGGAQNGGLALDEDGKTVIAPFVTEEWREGLRYMNNLYKEGLLSASVFTDDATQFKATLNNEDNVVGLVSAGSTSNWTNCDTNENFLELTMIPPLTGPEGICYTPYTEYSPSPAFFITSACENKDLAFRLGDWFMDPDNSRIARFGEEGIDWSDDPEILSQYTNAYVEAGLADSVGCVWMTNIWTEPSNKHWHNVGPYYESLNLEPGGTTSSLTPFDESSKSGMLLAYNIEWYLDKHPEYVLPLLHYTQEESEQCSQIILDITTFVEQTKAEFITGSRDIESGWESYINELEQTGLSQWLEIAQDAYDRSQS